MLLGEDGGSVPLMIGETVQVDVEVPFAGGPGPQVGEPAVNFAGGDVPFAAGGVFEAVPGGREPFGGVMALFDGVPGLAEVLAAVPAGAADDWTLASWLNRSRLAELGGTVVVHLQGGGNLDPAVQAARRAGPTRSLMS